MTAAIGYLMPAKSDYVLLGVASAGRQRWMEITGGGSG